MPAWGPPQGDDVQFAFTVVWGSPNGDDIAFAFQAGGPQYLTDVTLGSTAAYGVATVTSNSTQQAYPTGFNAAAYGTATLTPGAATISVPGANYASYGGATVVNAAQGVSVGGIAPPPNTGPNEFRQVPSPTIWFRVRYLYPSGFDSFAMTAWAHTVTPEVQTVSVANYGILPPFVPNPRVEYTVRYIAPPFITSNVFGTALVARNQFVTPTGWDSSLLSTGHQLDINLQRLFPDSTPDNYARYGEPTIRNALLFINPFGWASSQFNFPVVQNRTRIVYVQPYMNTNSDPTQWPPFAPFVENRNRVLRPSGWTSSRYPTIGTLVENTADPILPAGLDATLWGAGTFIAHRDRTVVTQGWDSFYNTAFTVVYNDARVLAPSSWGSSTYGTPSLLNLNRTVRQHSGFVGGEFGTAFVAYRVRSVFPGVFIEPPASLPTVRLNPYPIAPAGFNSYRTGGHFLEERFTIVRPPSVNVPSVPRIGEPVVLNRNRRLFVGPTDQALYGRPTVFNSDAYLPVTAGDQARYGSHLIMFRTRTLVVAPISVPVFSVTHTVRNDTPDPPATQRLFPPSFFIGFEFNPGIVPEPVLSIRAIFPEGIAAPALGSPSLTRNSIEPNSIIDLDQVGTPTMIFTRVIYPFGAPYPRDGNPGADGSVGDSDLLVHESQPRLSPHTIYAPSSDQATAQAIQNHPPNLPHVIDAFVFVNGERTGRPTVSTLNRTIGPVPTHQVPNFSVFGFPTLTQRLQYVYPQPIRSLRMGLPVFLNVPQYVTFEWYGGFVATSYGTTTVAYAPTRPMPAPAGFVATEWGTTQIELKNRVITVDGIPHRGNPQQGFTNPWGLPLVGFPRQYTLGGYNFTLWGVPRVEYRIRNVYPQGWDAYEQTLDDLSGWNDRMRVTRRNRPGSLPGIASTAVVGTPFVAYGLRGIVGRGIAPPPTGTPSVAARIYPTGWDSFEAGDVDRWEAGKIKPHGDDLSSVGTPRMVHTLRPTSADDWIVTSPRVAVPVYTSGIPEIGFAGPSVTDQFGCSTRVVSTLTILPPSVPNPTVTA